MTDILVRTSDNLVVYQADSLEFNDGGKCKVNGRMVLSWSNNTDYAIYKDVVLPNPFYVQCYTYDGSTFTATAKLAERIAQEEAKEAEELLVQKQVLLDQIEPRQQQIIRNWDGMANKKVCYDESIKAGITPPCEFDETVYTKALTWSWQVRMQNDSITTDNTIEEIQARLDRLEELEQSYPEI